MHPQGFNQTIQTGKAMNEPMRRQVTFGYALEFSELTSVSLMLAHAERIMRHAETAPSFSSDLRAKVNKARQAVTDAKADVEKCMYEGASKACGVDLMDLVGQPGLADE